MDSFVYQDTDSYENEISELYSYSEESEFFSNRNAFEESMEDCGLPLTWKHMVLEQKTRAINHLMTTLEVSCRSTRIKSCRALAYLIQGNFGECLTLEEQAINSRENVYQLYQHGIFLAFVQQMSIEANLSTTKESKLCSQSSFSSAQLFNESTELRLILSVLYTITETMYHAKDSQDDSTTKIPAELRQQFVRELQNPIGDELLTVTLFQMLNNFCGGQAPHYPVRKITLLLWKVILITLGGSEKLRELKDSKRRLCNLDPVPDDTMEVVKSMVPSPSPMMPEQSRVRAALLGSMMANKRKVFKQPAFDDAVFAYAKECLLSSLAEINQAEDNEMGSTRSQNPDESMMETGESASSEPKDDATNSDIYNMDEALNPLPEIRHNSSDSSSSSTSDSGLDPDKESADYELNRLMSKFSNHQDDRDSDDEEDNDHNEHDGDDSRDEDEEPQEPERPGPMQSRQHQPLQPQKAKTGEFNLDGSPAEFRGLPWKPKVRKVDLSQHITNLRQKFLGYTLPDDIDTTFGLPGPIIEGINVLRRHMYVSLAELQLEREESIQKYPLTLGELDPNYRDEAAERLYGALLPRLPQHMIALLKILLAASTLASKNKSDRVESINIMAEINPDVSSQSIVQTVKMNVDAIRHKEVIIKSISAILLLLLKHFKINHAYQFEYVSQQLMFANCIPLILKFLSQDINSYIENPRSSISAIDFPACVIGEQPELTTVAIELSSFQPYCWRNMFSCINLVRCLNKLTKWKHSRIMMMVVFKSSQTLLKALNVKHSMFQLYVLKLLKVQLKFLGRQWKKSNMKLISPIYQKVRHRLTDDWAYSNDNEARPWDFQAEEFTLQANINRFHQRRYHDLLSTNNNSSGAAGKGSSSRHTSWVFEQFDKLSLDDIDLDDDDHDSGTSDLCSISPNFEHNYQKWLDSEVFQRQVDWDKLLD